MAVLTRVSVLAAACLCAVSGLSLRADGDEQSAGDAEATEELRVDSASCAAQLDSDSTFMDHVVKDRRGAS